MCGTASHTHTTGHGRVGTDVHVVANLDQVVQLDAIFDHRVVQRTAIDAGVGTDLDIVADAHSAELLDLDPFALCGAQSQIHLHQ